VNKTKTMKHEEAKAEAQRRPGSLQRETKGEQVTREQIKANLRKEIKAVREGHVTGGYCDTEALQAQEKKLHAILTKELEDIGSTQDYASVEHRKLINKELAGLSWKPRLVVDPNQD
jgi:FKBP-type peptidyl-prolyl cis-trans isomerase (trigger factor)